MTNSIYEKIEINVAKSNDGHWLHKYKCVHCGYILISRDFSIKRIKKCNHRINQHNIDYSTKLGNIYYGMLNRCYDDKNKDYNTYGGKGIKICEKWFKDFNAFKEWSYDNGYCDGMSIDRIDSNDDYKPDNCRWVAPCYNSKYKSTTNIINVDGFVNSGRGWSMYLGKSVNHINKMIKKKGLEETINYIRKNIQG